MRLPSFFNLRIRLQASRLANAQEAQALLDETRGALRTAYRGKVKVLAPDASHQRASQVLANMSLRRLYESAARGDIKPGSQEAWEIAYRVVKPLGFVVVRDPEVRPTSSRPDAIRSFGSAVGELLGWAASGGREPSTADRLWRRVVLTGSDVAVTGSMQ